MFVQPWTVYKLFYTDYSTVVKKLPNIMQWQCKSCKADVLCCDKCMKAWPVARALDNLEQVTCPHCGTKYFYNFG
jgi:DNA-directed RNA polymerase subunit RPC12/RpoP